MSDAFHIELTADHDRRRIHIRSHGPMDAAAYVERQMDQLSADSELCAYDRLTDLSGSHGFVTADHVARYAEFWQGLRFYMPRTIRVAVVTDNRLVVARLPMANLSFPKQIMKSFTTADAAGQWLDAYAPTRAA